MPVKAEHIPSTQLKCKQSCEDWQGRPSIDEDRKQWAETKKANSAKARRNTRPACLFRIGSWEVDVMKALKEQPVSTVLGGFTPIDSCPFQ
ncbi:MAG: hypothetical protein EP343_08410 [Deltaproteobacteria bacterium]|nr:MAG: hypothetical protein EP343_08410 [Deltaproteobacteria bacterium]